MPVALELFAGIGGGSLALQAVGVRTAAYCEINPFCRAVLQSNMGKGKLHTAPILPDVTTLSSADLPRGAKIDMIAGGFPCKGLSSIGSKRGLYGDARSRLVTHVYRLVSEIQPKYVFLENTPLIVRDPNYQTMIQEFLKRGYRCAFIITSASQYGARHQRKRWFFLAIQPGSAPLKMRPLVLKKINAYYHQKIKVRLEDRQSAKATKTCFVFGNTVCPPQAANALRVLNDVLKGPASRLTPCAKPRNPMLPTVVETNGQMSQDDDYQIPSVKCRGNGFTVIPTSSSKGSPQKERIREKFWRSCMPTPRTGANCAVSGASMTGRSANDAGNFLLSATEMHGGRILDSLRRNKAVSDSFWAVEMGFPQNWISRALMDGVETRRS